MGEPRGAGTQSRLLPPGSGTPRAGKEVPEPPPLEWHPGLPLNLGSRTWEAWRGWSLLRGLPAPAGPPNKPPEAVSKGTEISSSPSLLTPELVPSSGQPWTQTSFRPRNVTLKKATRGF